MREEQPWDEPEHAHLFQMPNFISTRPGWEANYTTDGFALAHYSGNPTVFHRDSACKLDETAAGAPHTWLAGEAAGNWTPWAYPFNWRPLKFPLNGGPDGFGEPTGAGALFLFADGGVQYVSNDVDSALFLSPPAPDPERTRIPDRRFDYREEQFRGDAIRLDEESMGLLAEVWCDAAGVEDAVLIRGRDKSTIREPDAADVRRIAAEFPGLRKLINCPVITDEVAALLAGFQDVEVIETREVDVSERGFQDLRRLSQLKLLIIARGDDLDAVRNALPGVAIRR